MSHFADGLLPVLHRPLAEEYATKNELALIIDSIII